jgi:hypothetical protein
VSTPETSSINLGLHDVAGLRWPKEPLSGDGRSEKVAVPVPRLPWSTAAIEVPLGASAARHVERVTGLRKIFGYGVAPVVIALFVIADVLLLWGRFGSLNPPSWVFSLFSVAGVALILCGFIPNLVARASGTPYVSRGRLRFPAARNDVLEQLVKLNPQVEISGWPVGDLPSRR